MEEDWVLARRNKMADDLETLRQEIERKSLELESMKKLLARKVGSRNASRGRQTLI